MSRSTSSVFLCVIGIILVVGITAGQKESLTDEIFHRSKNVAVRNRDFISHTLDNLPGSWTNVILTSEECHACDEIFTILTGKFTVLTINDVADSLDPTTNHNNTETFGSLKFVTLLLDDIQEFGQMLENLSTRLSWNPRAKHLVVVPNKPNEKHSELLFKQCWLRDVLNVGLVYHNHEETYTYNPYIDNFCERVNNTDMFYDKLKNMNGHKIRTKFIPFVGKDVVRYSPEEDKYQVLGKDYGYMEAFFRAVNALPDFENLSGDTFTLYENFSYRYQSWNVRKFGDVELWFNAMVTDSGFEDRSEQLYPLGTDDLCIIVPKSGLKIPNIFKPYNCVIWFHIVVSVAAFSLYYHASNKRRGVDDNAFVRTLGVFVGKNLPPGPLGRMEKFSFVLWTMYSFLIVSIYQGLLYESLTNVRYYPEIDTLDEFYSQMRPIHVYESYHEIIKKHVPNRIPLIPMGANYYADYLLTHRSYAYVFQMNLAKYLCKWRVYSENGVPFYHLMKQCPAPMFVTYHLPYGSPYLDKLNRVALTCREGGLTEFWENQANLNALLTGKIIEPSDRDVTGKRLSLDTQLIGLYLWGFGLVVSFLCFLHEIRSGHRESTNE